MPRRKEMANTEKPINRFWEKAPRILMFLCVDIASLLLAFMLACWLPRLSIPLGSEGSWYFPFGIISDHGVDLIFTFPQVGFFILLYLASFTLLRLYNSVWTLSGMNEGVNMIAAVGLGALSGALLNRFLMSHLLPIVFLTQNYFELMLAAGFQLIFTFISRFGFRLIRRFFQHSGNRLGNINKTPILIVGAGFFGKYVKSQIEVGEEGKHSYIAAFVDDDSAKIGMRVDGTLVRGNVDDIPKLVERLGIREIIIAIPSLSETRKAEILSICVQTKCHVRAVARLQELNETPTMRDIREAKISDILFRKEVELDRNGIESYISHKSVLITGGGGSIGSEIARQVARFYPSQLILFDIYENTTYELYCELKHNFPWLNVIVRIGSVREKSRVDEVMREFSPDLVLHTAAHKHVPLMENSPNEAIKNNVGGTLNVLRSAEEHHVARFVQLSTDKAVNPTNVMGASKRVCELLVQNFARTSRMKCMTVRFGNVLGSHGSVIPLFEKQIASGGPVLVTHPDITRFFMTIPEAAQLVLQAGAYGETGAVYVLDMGEPIKILDLAEKMIRFHGYEPNVSMDIEFIGLRPGEKMFEELLMDDEQDKMVKTAHGRIFKAYPAAIDHETFLAKVEDLLDTAQNHPERVIDKLHLLVPNFQNASETKEECSA